jgi:hypothetical protein
VSAAEPPIETTATEPPSEGLPVVAPPRESEWKMMLAQADQMAASGLVPGAYRGRPENVVTAALMGRELGWGVTTAMRFIAVIDGKPTVSPEGMEALVRRAGHSLTGDVTHERAVARGKRADTGDMMEFEFTLDDAVRAGLCKRRDDGTVYARSKEGKVMPWEAYTRSMLWARALGQLCRMLYADVLLGAAYVPEEMGADVDERGNAIDVQELPPPDEGRQRRIALADRIRGLDADRRAILREFCDEHGITRVPKDMTDEQVETVEAFLESGEQTLDSPESVADASEAEPAGETPATAPEATQADEEPNEEQPADSEAERHALHAAAMRVQKLLAQLPEADSTPVIEYVRQLHHQKVNGTLTELGIDHEGWPIDLRRLVLTAELLHAQAAENEASGR